MKIVIVGAGIAGLAAAWELLHARDRKYDVTVLESERRAGGVIVSEQIDGFVVEGGPDAFLASEQELPDLAKELGIADRVVSQQARGTTIWNGKELAPIDEGRAAALLGIEASKNQVATGFRSFAAGMQEPVTMLSQRLSGVVRFAQGVAGLAPQGTGWRLAVTGGSAHDADAVLLALPAYLSGRLLEMVGVTHARALADVVYAPSTTVSLAYRETQLERPLAGSGFVVSPDVSGQIRACTYSSAKFPGRAPQGSVLLRAFLAPGDGNPAARAHPELAKIQAIRGEPLWSRAYSWARGLPRYRAGHREHLENVRRRLTHLPPIAIAGAGYDGAGVSACVRSGRAAARLIAQRMAR